MSTGVAIGVAVVLLGLNGFFVGAEFALISARRTVIEPQAATSRAARITLGTMENVSLKMAGAQLGITVCSLGLGALGEPAVAALIEPGFAALGLPEAVLHPVAFALALLIVVYLHVTVGEMVPKNIALALPDRAALILAPPLVGIVTVLRPVIALLNWFANLTLRLVKVTPKDEMTSAFTRDEVAGLVAQSHREGLLDVGEEQLVTGALRFSERSADTVAVPLADIVTVDASATPAEIEAAAHRSGYSRLPVRGDPAGRFVGYLHIKDVLAVPAGQRHRPISTDHIRALPTLAPDTPLTSALAEMRRPGTHLCGVGTDPDRPTAVIALDDVLTELVGDTGPGPAPVTSTPS